MNLNRLRPLCAYFLLALSLTPASTLAEKTAEKIQAAAEQLTPSFDPPAKIWSRVKTDQTVDQPVTFEFRTRPDFKVIHYRTWQPLENNDDWANALKQHCTQSLPQLSAALSTNIPSPKDVKIGNIPACQLRIQTRDNRITEHYIFVWRTRKETSKRVYQAHTVTATFPKNYLAQGHEALEAFFKSIKVPEDKL